MQKKLLSAAAATFALLSPGAAPAAPDNYDIGASLQTGCFILNGDCTGARRGLVVRQGVVETGRMTWRLQQFNESVSHTYFSYQRGLGRFGTFRAAAGWQEELKGTEAAVSGSFGTSENSRAAVGLYVGHAKGRAAAGADVTLGLNASTIRFGNFSYHIPASEHALFHHLQAKQAATIYGGLTQAFEYAVRLSPKTQVLISEGVHAGLDIGKARVGVRVAYSTAGEASRAEPHGACNGGLTAPLRGVEFSIGTCLDRTFYNPVSRQELKLSGRIAEKLNGYAKRLNGYADAIQDRTGHNLHVSSLTPKMVAGQLGFAPGEVTRASVQFGLAGRAGPVELSGMVALPTGKKDGRRPGFSGAASYRF